MANERRLISCCGDCIYYSNKRHKCTICNSEESDPRNPFYDDCPLPKGMEVVYCKDCKHFGGTIYGQTCRLHSYGNTRVCMKEDDFCSCGEKKGGASDG